MGWCGQDKEDMGNNGVGLAKCIEGFGLES